MRITSAQLLAAADSLVAGVEVWVQAQQQLGINTDLSAAAVSICCGDGVAHITLPAGSGGALLQLAMNCRNSATAAAAALHMPAIAAAASRLVPALLQPGVAHRLLLTAATRQHAAAMQHMVKLLVMQQHIDAAALEAMLRQLVKRDNNDCYLCLTALCQLPAAALLSSSAVAQLLLVAIQESVFDSAIQLCGLAGARQLTSEQVDSLLQAHMREDPVFDGHWEFLDSLCLLPGAMQLSSNALVRLLHTAFDAEDNCYTEVLCRLPAAAAISSADVAGLLHAAFAQPCQASMFNLDKDIVEDLVHLPGFHQLASAEVVAELLPAAATYYHDAGAECPGLQALCALPAAQELSSEHVLQALIRAVQGNDVCTEVLCTLPAAQQLDSEAVRQLLQAAESNRECGHWCTKIVRRLPAAQEHGGHE